MPKSEETPFNTYLQTVLLHLHRLSPAQRAVIQAELEAHLADAAQERGCRPDDPALQAAVMTELGPAKRLGKAWAQAYHPWEGTMHALTMVVFWVLWVLFSTVGWGVHSLGSSDTTFMWYTPLGAMGVIALQSLLLREIAGVRWWRSWLLVSLAPWLIRAGVSMVVPWATFTEQQWELTFLFIVQLTGMALGVGQWLVLRRHVTLAGLWIIVPALSLAVAMITAQSMHINLVVYDVRPDVIARIRGWEEVHMLRAMVFGAIDGIVTGTILLGLLSPRAFGQAQRLA